MKKKFSKKFKKNFSYLFYILIFVIFIFLNFNEFKEYKLSKQSLENNSLNKEIEFSLDKNEDDFQVNNKGAIPKVSPEREKEILDLFDKEYSTKKESFVSYDELNNILEDLRKIDGERRGKGLDEIPGAFYFNEDYTSFYIVCKKLVSEEFANRVYQHEMEHFMAVKKHNIPASFTIFIVKINNKEYVFPATVSDYPNDLSKEQVEKIKFESTNAVQEKSEFDQKALDEYTEK